MQGSRPTSPMLELRVLCLCLLGLGMVLVSPAAAAGPGPVRDSFGLLTPQPGCGVTGSALTTRLLHQVRNQRPGQRRGRQAVPMAPPPPALDVGAMAWQALYGCPVGAHDLAPAPGQPRQT